MESLTSDEWQDLYLGLSERAGRHLGQSQKPGQEMKSGHTAGLRATSTTRNKLMEGGNYVVKAMDYIKTATATQKWDSYGHLKANVWSKAKNLILDDRRNAKTKGALQSQAASPGDLQHHVHENIYDIPDARPFEDDLANSPLKQDQDALRLWKRCMTDSDATTVTDAGISFKAGYIAAKEGWTLDEYGHARKQLLMRGDEFMRIHLEQREMIPGFLFGEAVREGAHASPKRTFQIDGE